MFMRGNVPWNCIICYPMIFACLGHRNPLPGRACWHGIQEHPLFSLLPISNAEGLSIYLPLLSERKIAPNMGSSTKLAVVSFMFLHLLAAWSCTGWCISSGSFLNILALIYLSEWLSELMWAKWDNTQGTVSSETIWVITIGWRW